MARKNTRAVSHPEDGNERVMARRRQAFMLRTEQRMNYREIAKAMAGEGLASPRYTHARAHADVQWMLKQYHMENVEMVQVWAQEQYERLEKNYSDCVKMLNPRMVLALAGNDDAAHTAMKLLTEMRRILDQENKLKGLYPKEVVFAPTTNNVLLLGENSVDLSDRSQTLALAQALFADIDEEDHGSDE